MTVINEAGEQGFKHLQIPQPQGLDVEKGSELLIIKEWLSAGIPALSLAVLMFGGGGICFAIQGEFFCVILMVILFCLNALYYLFVYGAINTTEIRVSLTQLAVENSVHTWNNRKIASTDIEQLYCQKVRNWGERHFWGDSHCYNVWVVTKDGQNISLIQGLHEPLEAVYIEQEIERFLSIEPRAVPGAFQYL